MVLHTLISLLSMPDIIFWGTVNNDFSTVMTVIQFQYDIHKPMGNILQNNFIVIHSAGDICKLKHNEFSDLPRTYAQI
jgi:hypothetical protein